MPSMWSCSPCAVLLLSAVVGREVGASQVGKRHKDVEHRVEKAQAHITALPAFARKREATMCASDYSLCPASLDGGCCPQRYGCSTDACYATTAGTASACGKVGFYDCPISLGAGCCPEGYVCGARDCAPPAGATSAMTSCPANYHLCPASLNYGCCQSGLGCGLDGCYTTTPTTTTYTKIVTTTIEGGQTVTSTTTATTVMVPSAPTGTATNDAVAKFSPTRLEKSPATSAPNTDSDGGGLSKGALAGIIVAAVAILLGVFIAAFLIIRRVKRVAAEATTAKASSSGDGSRTQRPMAQYPGAPSSSQMDGMSYDPLMVISPEHSSTGTPHEIAVTPGYVSATPSEGIRLPSMDSSQGGSSYFDIPARVSNLPGRHSLRTSIDSQGNVQQHGRYSQPPHHGRHWSNTSDLSATSSEGLYRSVGSPLIPAELDISGGFIPELPSADSATEARRRSGSTTLASPRPSMTNPNPRRHSATSAVVSPGSTPGQPLDVVNESVEIMHGYYGPRHNQVGQTAAGLEVGVDVTSPLAVRFSNTR